MSRSCKRSSKNDTLVPEKAVEGLISYSIPQSPPKNCVLEIQHPDGSHAGYASCVKLYNGENGLLTAFHLLNQEGWVASMKRKDGTSARIPLEAWEVILQSQNRDFALLRGPPHWESLIGCKAAYFTNAQQLRRSKVTLFSYDQDNGWMATNGQLVGKDARFVHTLCNTTGGHSGTPIFHGKCILGVHAGAHRTLNVNLMSVIPPIPNLTAPDYVYETTSSEESMFTPEELEKLYDEYSLREVESIRQYRRTQRLKEVEEDVFFEAEAPKTTDPLSFDPQPPTQSGNGSRGPDRETTGNASIPRKSNADTEIADKLLDKIASKFDFLTLQEKAAQMLAEKLVPQEPPAKKRRQRRNRKRRQAPLTTSNNISNQSTIGSGAGQNNSSPPASDQPGGSQNSTTPAKRLKPSGVEKSQGVAQSWQPKQPASGGPSSAQKPN